MQDNNNNNKSGSVLNLFLTFTNNNILYKRRMEKEKKNRKRHYLKLGVAKIMLYGIHMLNKNFMKPHTVNPQVLMESIEFDFLPKNEK